jgi:hypothetical protein
MVPVDPGSAREFLEAVIAAFSVLGGVMAYCSGYAASNALDLDEPPEVIAQSINEGIGVGFDIGVLSAIFALMIMGWS